MRVNPKKKGMKKPKRKKSTVTDKLYEAVVAYVQENSGSVAVIGGIALVDEGRGKSSYGVMVRCLGKKPVFTEQPTKTPNKKVIR